MRFSYTYSGLLGFAYGPLLTISAAVPKPGPIDNHIVNVHRDIDALHAAVERQANRTLTKRASYTPYDLDYAGYWFADITAGGEPAQVLLDTGSADLWLVNPAAPSDATSGVQTWNPDSAQNTSIMSGYSFSIGYGQGGNGVSGDVYQTSVCIGPVCTNMAVGSATHDQGLGSFPRSGIMGLAFQGGNSISPGKQKTYMESIEHTLDRPIFATRFSPSGGKISFGDVGFSYVAPLQKITVDSSASARYPYSWSFTGVQYYKNEQSLGTFDVVFDTGGPMSSAAESIVRGYYNGIPGVRDVRGDASSWTVPCGTQLPDLHMNLGGALLIIPGERFYNGNAATSGECTVWFVKENSATRGVIGDPFFTQHVVIFNQADSTIQWGNQA